jgi:hypothetical protein
MRYLAFLLSLGLFLGCGAPDVVPPDGDAGPHEPVADTSDPADTAQPDTAQPDTAQPDTAQPDTAQPDTTQPDVAPTDARGPFACDPSDELACDDGNVCTTDACDIAVGCMNENNTESCDDGDPCTLGDVCAAGACAAGPTNTCDGSLCEASMVGGRLVHGQAEPLVKVDPDCGKLSYGTYAAQDEKDAIHLLPDFSYAGYMGGGVPLPDVPGKVFLEPAQGDNSSAIQAAIDEVSLLEPDAAGFRGAVVLAAGTYEVGEPLKITTGGVVLRGAGQGIEGTVLVATKMSQHDLVLIQGVGQGLGKPDEATAIASPDVPVGAIRLKLASVADFEVGDLIGVRRTPNQAWIDALGMAEWGWEPASYAITHEARIVAIEDSFITVEVPIVDAIKEVHGGGLVFKADVSGRIARCGVEDLRLESQFSGPEDEEHGWNAIKLDRVENSWVRRVTAVHFGYAAVSIHNASKHNTVEEVAQLDPVSKLTGGRRYSFNVSGGTGNLFQRCFARDGRHNFVTGSRVTGPNVWLDCLSVQNNSDEGPHHRWATGLLFDSCMSKTFNVQNRKSSGSGHGWAGAQTLFWNILATGEIRCDAPLSAMNWVVGGQGKKAEGIWAPEEPFGWWESENIPAKPRSLYLAQLADRLGAGAVAAVTIKSQNDGPIYELLNAWAGEGLLAEVEEGKPVQDEICPGIQQGTACCPLSCGICGGAGCSQLPGGAQNCCTGAIKEANKSCTSHSPPCVID